MLPSDRFVVYGTTCNHSFDQRVLELTNGVLSANLTFSHINHTTFPDGEPGFKIRKPEKIRGRHAVLFACPVTYKVRAQMKDIIAACSCQYGARSLLLVLSFLCFRRQDRLNEHEITRLRWFMRDLKHWGVDRVVVCEPHSEEHARAYADEFGVELLSADPTRDFADAVGGVIATLGRQNVVFYSPDFGSIKRAARLAKHFGCPIVATPKVRAHGSEIEIDRLDADAFMAKVREAYSGEIEVIPDVEQVAGKHVFMREDEVSTARTSASTAVRLKNKKAASVRLVATHPVCSPGWREYLFPEGKPYPFDQVWLGDTRPRGRDDESEYEGSTGGEVKVVSMAPVMARALKEALERIVD
ncbi:MAG: hypothetical protein ACM3NH_03410 [Candidatus Saccharibacteria bacterium]